MKLKYRATLQRLVIVLLLTLAEVGHAQVLKYDNDTQLLAAAAVSPDGTRQIITRLTDTCSSYSPSLRDSGERELKSWNERHRTYLEESIQIRKQVESQYEGPSASPQTRQAFKHMLDVAVPQLINNQYQAIFSVVDSMPSLQGKISICNSYIQAIGDKKFDLKTNDPTLSEFFDKRIKDKRDRTSNN